MRKKIIMMLMALSLSAVSYAQFEQGKMYASAGLSGTNLCFNESEKWKFDLSMKGGYMIEDSWMVTGLFNYKYRKYEPNTLSFGAGIRYYIVENGLFMGAGANYLHYNRFDDFQPTVNIGYAFFISRTVTIEPEFYYNQSLKDHSNYSEVGFRVGLGIYLDELF